MELREAIPTARVVSTGMVPYSDRVTIEIAPEINIDVST
jgi:hypothetical protein